MDAVKGASCQSVHRSFSINMGFDDTVRDSDADRPQVHPPVITITCSLRNDPGIRDNNEPENKCKKICIGNGITVLHIGDKLYVYNDMADF
jgi:hypothetical protein